MIISIEISLYPLDKNYVQPIRSFIDKLNTYGELKIKVQAMSTFITGEYDIVMDVLTKELKSICESKNISVSVLKIVNLDLSDQ
jgi:uncharacterized protein YqgV (UPF0045/DUF77 family)